jgi:hypothetical protein
MKPNLSKLILSARFLLETGEAFLDLTFAAAAFSDIDTSLKI